MFTCNDEEDDVEGRYTLVVANNTSTVIDMFLEEERNDTGFMREGSVNPNDSEEINDLVIGETYTLKVSNFGEGLDNYFFEETFVNEEEPELIIQITR